jgi:hypothetical protein
MGRLLTGFGVGLVSLSGTAALLALARLVLVQVRGLTRLTRQLSDPHDQPAGSWEFTDCAAPPGWRLPPVRPTGDLEPWQRWHRPHPPGPAAAWY